MALSEDFLAELKMRNDIESVVSSYVTLKRGGRNPKGLCPFHNEKTPSFTLYPENGSFYCFGCGTGGDVIRFIRLMENLDYIDAVKFLADRCGMQMPQEGYDDSAANLKRTIYAINRETARFYHAMLKSPRGQQTYGYFLQRGMTDATIVHFGLGYAADGWSDLCDHLRSKGYTEEQMLTAGVAFKSRNNRVLDRFRDRAMFPILDVRGNVIAFGGRRMKEEDSAKYINTADTPVFKKSHNVYGLNFAKTYGAEQLLLCEGYMDTIALHQAGFQNAVAPLGTAFTEEQALLLSRYTKELVLVFDADGAGQKATDRALGILEKTGLKVRVLRIPDGKDPDEFLKRYGRDGPTKFKKLLEGAATAVEYKLFCAAAGLDLTDDTQKITYLERAAVIIGDLDSPVEADVYATRVAQQCGVSKDAVFRTAKTQNRQATQKREREQLRQATKPTRTDPVDPKRVLYRRAANAEEGLLSVLLGHQDFIPIVSQKVTGEDFMTDFNRKVYQELVNRSRQGKPFDITLMGEVFTGEEAGRLVRLQSQGAQRGNSLEECAMYYQIMLEERLKDQLRHVDTDSDEDYIQKMKELVKTKTEGVTES